jgi:predicted transcriptional regulator of viral defense system
MVMKSSKYTKPFEQLLKQTIFTAKEGRNAGISSRMLSYFHSKGLIERVSRGIYKSKKVELIPDFEWEDLALTALTIPNGVICLISALCYYGLTDEIMREFWIAVPHSTSIPKRENTHAVRMRNISLGQTMLEISNHKLPIFDRERTVVDAFRYLDQEIALKALQIYLKPSQKHRPDLQKLLKYAKIFHVNLVPYIKAFTL